MCCAFVETKSNKWYQNYNATKYRNSKQVDSTFNFLSWKLSLEQYC